MGGPAETKDDLIRQIGKLEKDIARLRGLCETNQKKIEDQRGKIAMVEEVRKLSDEAAAEQQRLDKDVNDLSRLLMRVEALAESENSRNSQNEQVRQINDAIGQAVEELSEVEQRLRQAEADRKDVESELESVQFEFNNRAGGAAIRLEQAYKAIQDTRQEIANVRRQNLTTFLDREDRLARAEVENQRLTASSLLYRQLVSSLQLELQVLNDETKQGALQRELEKIEQAISAIPQRQPLSPEVRQAEEQACTEILQEIHAATEEVKITISKMATAEKETDDLNGEIRKAQDVHEKHRRELTELDDQIDALQREIDELKEQENSSARREIEKLEAEIAELKRETEALQKRLAVLKEQKGGSSEIPPAMLTLIERIRTEGGRLEEEKRQLENERDTLEKANEKLRNDLQHMQAR